MIDIPANRIVKATVNLTNSFSTLLLLLKNSPLPPNEDEIPLPCICKRITIINATDTMISRIIKNTLANYILFLLS